MGLSLGGSTGSASGTKSASGTSSNQNTYSPWQSLLQGQLGTTLSSLLGGTSSGTESPGVKSMQTQSDSQINKNYSTLGTNLNKNLASRGFANSGTAGNTALQTEMGRQGAIAGNESNFAGLQLQQNQNFLSDALMAAFSSMGNTGATSGQSQENTTGTQFGAGASFGIPGFGKP